MITGVTIAFSKLSQRKPSDKAQFTNFFIDRRRISKHSFTRNVGQGSNRQDFVGDLVTIFITDILKAERPGGSGAEVSKELTFEMNQES